MREWAVQYSTNSASEDSKSFFLKARLDEKLSKSCMSCDLADIKASRAEPCYESNHI